MFGISKKALFLIALFTFAYCILSLVKHNHFLSGYDLAVSDQVMWKYAYFHNPLTTIHAYPFTYMMDDHVEFIYIFLAPLFWIWNNVQILIAFQAIFFCLSAIPVYLLAKKKGLRELLSLALVFSYLFFFGTQNALWNDVHSNVFAAGFLMWMIYFLESKNALWAWMSFFLAITSKEDMAFLTGAIGVVWLARSWKTGLVMILLSLFYLFLVFGVYYPHFTSGYRFSGHENLLAASTHLQYFFDTQQKREIILYSLGWFGFLPFFAPFYLIPWLADLFHFFVIGHMVASASEIFLHYRITLAPLLVWATIQGIMVFVRKKNIQLILALYLIFCAFFIQYALHLPLSYLTKSWFWQTSPSVMSINQTLRLIPPNASVVSQNNITPHIGHRDNIFTLWADTRGFKTKDFSPCGQVQCPWFHWVGHPQYMVVDTSANWDIRHLLQNRPDFLEALQTFEKLGKIQLLTQIGTTRLYRVLQNP